MSVKKYNILILVLISVTVIAGAVPGNEYSIEKGNQLFREGQFQLALEQYEQAQPEMPDAPVLLYNRANCFYKLEDYDQALNLYQQVSAESKDMRLVARSKYNLGNCHFQQGLKQRDGNPKKAMEELTTAVSFYRQGLDIKPQDEDARHNIAVARLIMKDILDQIKKQQEEEKKQNQAQQLAEKIKELLKRQVELLQKTTQNNKDPNEPDLSPEKNAGIFTQLADDQQKLKVDTAATQEESKQLLDQAQSQAQAQAQTPTPQPPPAGGAGQPSVDQVQQMKQIMETVTGELAEAVKHQETAVEHLNNIQPPPAGQAQEKAAQALIRALEAFPQKPPQEQQQQQDKQDQQQDQQEQQQQQDNQEQQQDQQEQQQQEQESKQEPAPDTTAQEIIDQEKQRKQQEKKVRRGGYQSVDKDW